MFKFPLAAMIGLASAVSAASADTIVIQGTPSFEPAIISHGPVAPFPRPHADGFDILSNPAFHRLAEMCETLGLDCGSDRVNADLGIHPYWTPRHIADAEKRLALLLAERDHYAEVLPVPNPHRLYGWNTPYVSPHVLPRQFSNLFPRLPHTALPHTVLPRPTVPHLTLPRTHVPHIPGFSGFNHRLNNPAVIPHGLLPRHILPRHSFPWRAF